jgi:hypothetical protein
MTDYLLFSGCIVRHIVHITLRKHTQIKLDYFKKVVFKSTRPDLSFIPCWGVPPNTPSITQLLTAAPSSAHPQQFASHGRPRICSLI